jgi:hypothetical protein
MDRLSPVPHTLPLASTAMVCRWPVVAASTFAAFLAGAGAFTRVVVPAPS